MKIIQINKTAVIAFLTSLIIGLPLAAAPSVHAAEASPEEAKLLAGITQIEAGSRSAYATAEDGTVWAWGGGYGSLGNGSTLPAYTPVKVHIDQVKQVSSGYRHTLFLHNDGTVSAVGGNEHGQLGTGDKSQEVAVEPVQVAALKDIVSVSAGDGFSLALDKDGAVWAWGNNEQGQLGNSLRTSALKPVKVEGIPQAVAVEAGTYVALAIDGDGQIWVWGLERSGEPDEIRKPTKLRGNGKFKAAAADYDDGVALDTDGGVWTWKNYFWIDEADNTLAPSRIPGLTDVVSVTTDAAVKADGTVWTWTREGDGKIRATQVKGISGAVSITGDVRNHYVLLKDGHVIAWGSNEWGQTGLGLRDTEITTPQPVKKSIKVVLNGTETELAMPPLLINGRAYVPLRGVFEQAGVTPKWDVSTRSVIAEKGETKIVLNSVSGSVIVNGKAIVSEQKPVFVGNDSVYVPLRLIGETLGAKVEWLAEDYTVRITF
ncbi:stalk domain-containing protein [Paenibacillus macerans]|uniref:stalk domain-containing protein n=1 Tax=Paenibacillus macerans TaxID=44252 RepID=UPI002E1F6473|nr:stalk domain-containing protein [Paenibacillus macerans]